MTGVMMTAALAAGIVLSPKGDADMTADVMDAVDRVRTAGGGEIRLTAGTYHFRSPQAMRFYVSNHDNPLPRNVFLPVTGLLAGSITGANTKAMIAYNDSLVHHGQLYNYLLGNGCTQRQALDYFARRSLRAAIVEVSKRMSRLAIIEAPVAFFVALMGNMSILTAAALQALLLVATASASVVAVFITLTIKRKRSKQTALTIEA